MSEHLTHVAVFEDASRILMHMPGEFPSAFQKALDQYYDYGMVACSTRGNRSFAVPFIEKYRSGTLNQQALQMISGALGWVSHRAADAQLNFLADQVDGENNPYYNGQDLKLYYEAIVVREVYQSGNETTLSSNEYITQATLAKDMHPNPASEYFNMEKLEILTVNGQMREALELHTFMQHGPRSGHLAEFIETHESRSQYYGENLPLYVQAFEHPDPVLMQAVSYRIPFYDPEDEVIRLVRDIQLKGNSKIPPMEALQKASGQSHYAKTLKLNIDYWMALGKFFDKEIEHEALEEVLNKRYS